MFTRVTFFFYNRRMPLTITSWHDLTCTERGVEDSFQLTTRDWAAFSAPPFYTHVYCNSNFPTLWVNNLLFIGISWKFWILCTKEKWTCSYEHVYKKTMQDVVGAMFSDQLHIVYVTVCIYMNQFTTNIFWMWSI